MEWHSFFEAFQVAANRSANNHQMCSYPRTRRCVPPTVVHHRMPWGREDSQPPAQPLNPGPFGPPQVVKLGDFGISTILRGSQALAKTQCGTPYYFSPGVPAALRSPGCDCTGIQGRCSRDRLSSMHWGYCYPAVDANGCIGTQPLNWRLGVPRLLVLVTGQFT